MQLHLEPTSKTPAYRQIVQQIAAQVRDGVLPPGTKLPSERGLAQELKIARGTIKRAYELLVRDQVIDVSRGRGAFVSSRQDVLPEGRQERALALIDQVLDQLGTLKLSDREIRTYFDIRLSERRERLRSFHVAAIDCNPEALEIFDRQLRLFQHLRLTRVQLDEVRTDAGARARLAPFDLILTTATHYRELQGLLPDLRARLLPLAVSPSQSTVIEIAGLNASQRMGVICHSDNFLGIIRRRLLAFDLPVSHLPCLRIGQESALPEFLEQLDIVFVPPGYTLQRAHESVRSVQEYTARGGRVISFDYQIERGSLLFVEERIQQLLNG